ncbi:MAG: sodium:proton antiporter NhaD [Rikenellaceae bacterium]
MEILLTAVFFIGYLIIALEHPLKINKAGTALITGILLWIIYAAAPQMAAQFNAADVEAFMKANPSMLSLSLTNQCLHYIVDWQIINSLGEISETLFFLIGAMTIVEIIDVHGGFAIITNRITTKSKLRLVWIVAIITFFLSALLDNMTTAIVMIMLVRRIIPNYKERWVFGSLVIIAANSGGAWSPIGDITTIMLWVNGNITADHIVPWLFLPSFVSCMIPTWIGSRYLHGMIMESDKESSTPSGLSLQKIITRKESISISLLGILCLVSVPIFKSVTHLPPFMGILLSLGVIWVYTELVYAKKKGVDESLKHRVPRVLRRIDTPTILFFLGILLAVSALQATGILGSAAKFLDTNIHNVYVTNIFIGLLSSVIDNVPLVAASMAMYPVADAAQIAASIDPVYMSHFVTDGVFWQFLAYCAGVGGSVLIIGSVAGVVVMGIEKMNFMWYMKNISPMALAGYLAGAAVYILQVWLFA